MGCSEGCDKVATEEHKRILKETREEILQAQEAITTTEIENERVRLEKEIDVKLKSEIAKYRKEYEENATNGAEIFANSKLKAKMTQEEKIEEEVQRRFNLRIEDIRKVGGVVRPIIYNEDEGKTTT